MLKNKLLSAMGGSEPSDPYFSNTVLLLHGEGTNGAQNNTFIDSSPNNFTITRNGNTTQGTFSPFSKEPGKWGVAFDGSGDYLTVPANSAFDFGTGNYTVEGWIFTTSTTFSLYATGGSGSNDQFVADGGTLFWGYSDGAFTGLEGFFTQNDLNKWVHVAVSRSGTSQRYFKNGTIIGEITSSASYGSSVNPPQIGRRSDDLYYTSGHISNLRVVKGTALYTSNFTPPTAPLTAVAGTSLLCCQDNRFKDNSSNNFTLTPNGNVAVTPFSPFANSAPWSASVNGGGGYFEGVAYFNGIGDYLSTDINQNLELGTVDFTLQCWVYRTATGFGPILALGDYSTNPNSTGFWFGLYGSKAGDSGSGAGFYAGGWQISGGDDIPLNQWTHVAWVRQSGVTKTYVNGFNKGTTSTIVTNVLSGSVFVGTDHTSQIFQGGYLSGLSLIKGAALYTSNFTPPTAPVTAVTNTALLLNFTNAGIYDNTGFNDLETVGNAQVSTTQKKFGTGAMYFDGSGDYLLAPNSQNIEFGVGDFTIEFWIYRVGSSVCYPIEKRNPFAVSGYSVILFNGTQAGFVASFDDDTWGVNISDSNALPQNTWAHVAITRSGNVWRLFVDGAQRAVTTTTTGAITNNAAPVSIGAQSNGSSSLNGYIDDLRITKGVARYTANFTPPTQAFPNK